MNIRFGGVRQIQESLFAAARQSLYIATSNGANDKAYSYLRGYHGTPKPEPLTREEWQTYERQVMSIGAMRAHIEDALRDPEIDIFVRHPETFLTEKVVAYDSHPDNIKPATNKLSIKDVFDNPSVIAAHLASMTADQVREAKDRFVNEFKHAATNQQSIGQRHPAFYAHEDFSYGSSAPAPYIKPDLTTIGDFSGPLN